MSIPCWDLTTLPRGKTSADLHGNHGVLVGVIFREPSSGGGDSESCEHQCSPSPGPAHQAASLCAPHTHLCKTLTVYGICTPQGPHTPSSQMRTGCQFY